MGSRVPADLASRLSPLAWFFAGRPGFLPAGFCQSGLRQIGASVGLAALVVVLGNRGLETAEANGDTRTLTLHHLHTDENITITYKRDGRFDDDALKKLDHFLRDWRKNESTHMDPRLYDVIWEVAREFGKDKVIQVVCGYRSPATNAMLRRRSSGVAQFSQHTLGKAMDFYIQGASLEEIREAGLRLQRGGVGYYPTSGSPFVHLDVGSVRHWPRMTHEQLARVFPDGRTVHIPADGQPLSGYAQALADIQKRGASVPLQASLATAGSARPKNTLASLFHADDEEDDRTQSAPATAAAATVAALRFSLASLSDGKASDGKAEPARSASAARLQRTAMAAGTPSTTGKGDATTMVVLAAERDPWAAAGLTGAPRPPAEVIHTPMSNPDSAPAVAPWPIRDADMDRVPLDIALSYAAAETPPSGSAGHDGGGDFDGRFAAAGRQLPRPAPAATPRATVQQRESGGPGAKKTAPVRPPASAPVVKVVVETAVAGMRYDDPWLRAIILAPRLYGSMTAMLHGDPDFKELRTLMSKPTSAVAMSFSSDPYPGINANSFSGEAVVLLTTVEFSQQTASLQK
jgi:uncharacterized protein YcbK (DUF882 family)